MLLHLIKKDILITKKLVLLTMFVIIEIPLALKFLVPTFTELEFVSFIYMVIFGELLILQAASQTEAKNPKVIALICSTPYSRDTFVMAKYILYLLIFAYCYVVHTVIIFFMNQTGMLDLSAVLTVLLVTILICGIYLPFEFKYGTVIARFFFIIVILVSSMGPSLFLKIFPNLTINFSIFETIPYIIKNIALALASMAALATSIIVSNKIFSNKEL